MERRGLSFIKLGPIVPRHRFRKNDVTEQDIPYSLYKENLILQSYYRDLFFEYIKAHHPTVPDNRIIIDCRNFTLDDAVKERPGLTNPIFWWHCDGNYTKPYCGYLIVAGDNPTEFAIGKSKSEAIMDHNFSYDLDHEIQEGKLKVETHVNRIIHFNCHSIHRAPPKFKKNRARLFMRCLVQS